MPEAELTSNINPDLIFGAVKRHAWWALMTAASVALLTLVVLSVLPRRYTSDATLVLVQQQIPQHYVVPTTTTDIGEALETTTQEVLSRTRLLDIIGEFDLFPKERARLSPEELETMMRKKIDIKPVVGGLNQKEVNTFKIAFMAETPRKAQAVTNRLTSLFIEQNLETRENQATVTTTFLKEQLAVAEEKLARQEARVRDFKLRNLGELPEQQGSNLTVLSGLQQQLLNIESSAARASEQRVYLQSLLNGYQNLAARGISVSGSAANGQKVNPAEMARADLARLRAKKSTLLSIDTPEHPDVIKVSDEIAQMQSLLNSLQAMEAAKKDLSSGKSTASDGGAASDGEADASGAQVKSQLEANRLELQNLAQNEKQVKNEIAQYQEHLNQTPVREQQLAGLMRDYDLLKQNYADLLGKETQSQLAGSLEKRQAGQQFRLVDRASLPVVPSFPKPLPIGLGGMAAGLLLGAAVAFLIDKKQDLFYSENDLAQKFPLPLVIAIPVLTTSAEERSHNWKRALEWVAASALVMLVFLAEFYELYLNRHG